MAYLKPPWFTARVFNKIAMATGISGSERLTLTARSSGRPQEIPVITVDVDGAHPGGSRALRGGHAGGRLPLQPVGTLEQRRAMALAVETVYSELGQRIGPNWIDDVRQAIRG